MSTASQSWIQSQIPKLEFGDIDGFVDALTPEDLRWLLDPLYDWESRWARAEQKEPLGGWRVWLILAGRGYGKTRTGAEWVRKQVELGIAKRIALVGRTTADVRDVMIEGESGLLAVSHPCMRPVYEPSLRKLTWHNSDGGVRATALCYSAGEPGLLRGPQHDAAWCDELASWRLKEAWDNLMLGLRLGTHPKCVVTTTPKPTVLLRDLMARASTTTTGGSTFDNILNLAPGFIEDVTDRYKGTHLGRQELYAEVLEESENALWHRAWINDHRWEESRDGAHPDLDALCVAIDPAGSRKETSSETGIIVAGRANVVQPDASKRLEYWVLDDRSGRYTPDGWGRLAVNAHYDFEGDCIVGEKNNGGDMVGSTVLTVDDSVPFKEVWASRGKAPRAGPVAALYQQGRVHHLGLFRDLEDQLCQWEPGEGTESPDRLDALVWAITHLMPTSREKKLTTGLDLGGGDLGRRSPWRGD